MSSFINVDHISLSMRECSFFWVAPDIHRDRRQKEPKKRPLWPNRSARPKKLYAVVVGESYLAPHTCGLIVLRTEIGGVFCEERGNSNRDCRSWTMAVGLENLMSRMRCASCSPVGDWHPPGRRHSLPGTGCTNNWFLDNYLYNQFFIGQSSKAGRCYAQRPRFLSCRTLRPTGIDKWDIGFCGKPLWWLILVVIYISHYAPPSSQFSVFSCLVSPPEISEAFDRIGYELRGLKREQR